MLMPASIISLFLLIAVPVVVLILVWAVVTLARVLFPKPVRRRKRVAPRQMASGTEMVRRVRSKDIVEDIYRQAAHPVEEEPHFVEDARQEFEPLFGDLWLRRN